MFIFIVGEKDESDFDDFIYNFGMFVIHSIGFCVFDFTQISICYAGIIRNDGASGSNENQICSARFTNFVER